VWVINREGKSNQIKVAVVVTRRGRRIGGKPEREQKVVKCGRKLRATERNKNRSGGEVQPTTPNNVPFRNGA